MPDRKNNKNPETNENPHRRPDPEIEDKYPERKKDLNDPKYPRQPDENREREPNKNPRDIERGE